jgi:hypothetical protein
MNIEFRYLYRDAANYKLFSSIIMSNRKLIPLEDIINVVEINAIDKMWFVPEKWNIPRLSFDSYIPSMDHEWHEIAEITFIEGQITDERDISEFIEQIKLP